MHEHPRVSVAEKFLTPGVCDWLIERAKPKIGRAHVFDATHGGGKIDQTRNNSATDFNIAETDLVLALIRARIATATGLAPEGMEHPQVLHYSVGQQFAPHFDFLDPAMPAYAQNIAAAGQRVATFLIYLNDEFDAAETSFLALDWRYRGSTKLSNNQEGPLHGTEYIYGARIKAYSYFDLAGSVNVLKGISLRAGINNLFDKDPPVLYEGLNSAFGNGNTFPGVYDPLGRKIFFGLTADF